MFLASSLIERGLMPRYEYRALKPIPAAEKAFLEWIHKLDGEFANRDSEHRSNIVREALHQLLREMHRDFGLTSVIATHNSRLAAACDRVLRLHEGRLVAAS